MSAAIAEADLVMTGWHSDDCVQQGRLGTTAVQHVTRRPTVTVQHVTWGSTAVHQVHAYETQIQHLASVVLLVTCGA